MNFRRSIASRLVALWAAKFASYFHTAAMYFDSQGPHTVQEHSFYCLPFYWKRVCDRLNQPQISINANWGKTTRPKEARGSGRCALDPAKLHDFFTFKKSNRVAAR
jgi:hypothetical protein